MSKVVTEYPIIIHQYEDPVFLLLWGAGEGPLRRVPIKLSQEDLRVRLQQWSQYINCCPAGHGDELRQLDNLATQDQAYHVHVHAAGGILYPHRTTQLMHCTPCCMKRGSYLSWKPSSTTSISSPSCSTSPISCLCRCTNGTASKSSPSELDMLCL